MDKYWNQVQNPSKEMETNSHLGFFLEITKMKMESCVLNLFYFRYSYTYSRSVKIMFGEVLINNRSHTKKNEWQLTYWEM